MSQQIEPSPSRLGAAYSYATCGSEDAYTQEKSYVVMTRQFLTMRLREFMQAPIVSSCRVVHLAETMF